MDVDTLIKLKGLILEGYDSDERLDYAREVVSPFIPKRLFKFRGVSKYSLDNFKSDTLFCAKADSFNDPFDCSLTFEGPDARSLCVKALDQLGVNSLSFANRVMMSKNPAISLAEIVKELDPSMTEAQGKEFAKDLEKIFYEPRDVLNSNIRKSCNICSLCERVDSLPMWAHYGEDHKGFAMEYDFSALPAHSSLRQSLWPVLYSEKMYDVTPQIFGRPVKRFSSLFLIGGALHKSVDWQYEQEWRIVLPIGAGKPAENISVPRPVGLYLGAKIDTEATDILVAMAKEKKVPVYRMEHSRDEFKMNSTKI